MCRRLNIMANATVSSENQSPGLLLELFAKLVTHHCSSWRVERSLMLYIVMCLADIPAISGLAATEEPHRLPTGSGVH